jgi:CubicO group peptidase (beta-lactamase class C family)
LLAVITCFASHLMAAEGPAPACANADATSTLVETGETFEQLISFDKLMRTFVRGNEIPAAALAVGKQGRLVYARGFGYADVRRKEPVQPDSLFRLASLSKPITAVVVLRLVDQGKLKLDDYVFDLLPHKPHLPHGGQPDSRLKQVTIRQLLQHTGGWDRDVSIDPMFQPVKIARTLGVAPPAGPDHIVRFMMGWQLDFDPGTRHAYSNFGYCVLGRVVQHVCHCGRPGTVAQNRSARSQSGQCRQTMAGTRFVFPVSLTVTTRCEKSAVETLLSGGLFETAVRLFERTGFRRMPKREGETTGIGLQYPPVIVH